MEESAKQALIELRHLRYFLAAADHGSFRKAGAALGRSQSAVSRCIADLENQLGASLFHRHTWGISPTFAGQRFLDTARKSIRIIGAGTQDVAIIGRGERGCVRIGIQSSIASGFPKDILKSYAGQHPHIRIELTQGNAAEHAAAIRRFHLDVAFLAGHLDLSGCEYTQLWSERLFAVLPVHHRLASHDALSWRDLAREGFVVGDDATGELVHSCLVRELTGLGRRPDIKVQSIGPDNLLPFVALGRRLTLVFESITAAQFPGLVYRPLLADLLPFSAVWSANNDNPAFRRLLSLAKAMAVRSVP